MDSEKIPDNVIKLSSRKREAARRFRGKSLQVKLRNDLNTTLSYDQLMEVGAASHRGDHIVMTDYEGIKEKLGLPEGENHCNVMLYHLKINKSFCMTCEANVRRMERGEPMVYSYSRKILIPALGSNDKVHDVSRRPDGTWVETESWKD